MRIFIIAAAVLGAAAVSTPAQGPPDAASVLAAARAALGGEARLSAVKTFVATGRTRQLQGDNLVPIEFEISCELPDKCIRRDENLARDGGPTTIGFSGGDLIQVPAPPPLPAAAAGRAGPPGTPPAAALAANRVNTTKQEFTRLWLGMFAAPHPSYELTFTAAGQAEAPQGQADVLDVKGANFAARFFVFQGTRLPIMLSWQGTGRGGPVENRLYYADYRDVDGLKFPFRLRRAVGPDTVEETTFDRYRLNVRIDPRKFEVRK
jgi:hypothetical protein